MKEFIIHCWDPYRNGRQVKIKALNTKNAEKKFYQRYPQWFIVKIDEVYCK